MNGCSTGRLFANNRLYVANVPAGYLTFVEREVTDSLPQILEQCCRRLNSLLSQWKTVAQTAHYARVC